MPLSISPKLNGIVLDTNVLSLLAAVHKLELLFQIAALPLFVTPTIVKEVRTGVMRGVVALKDVLSLIQAKKLEILRPNAAEQTLFVNFPRKLGRGEKEAIAVCLHRHLLFITHDRRAADYCDHSGIECIRLKELLARLLQVNLITQAEIDEILN